MPALTTDNKKKSVRTPEVKTPREPASPKNDIQFGLPIETDKIKVTFEGKKVIYHLKTTGETLVKEYDNEHALMIIHGRISRSPHGDYTQQCVAKARIAMLKLMPII